MPKVWWVLSHGFCSKFYSFPAVQKFWKSVKIWRSCRELKGGNFFETLCSTRTRVFYLPYIYRFWLKNLRCTRELYSLSGFYNSYLSISKPLCYSIQEGLLTLTAQRAACETWNAHPSYWGSVPLGPNFTGRGSVRWHLIALQPCRWKFLDNETL